MLRAAQMGLRPGDLEYMNMGHVVDMMIESANDGEEWAIKATQEDFDRF